MVGCRLVVPGLVLLAAVFAVQAGEKNKQPPAAAVIGVTVFREPGFALTGAEVVLEPDPDAKAAAPVKLKKQKAQSDPRGELAFRVPAVPMRYNLSVKAQGYEPDRRQVSIQGEEHQDVFFTLKPAAKQ